MTALNFNAAEAPPVETIADLKARVDIVEIVGGYATLKKRGADLWARCPLHPDKTPSFQVNPHWQNFRCWGCDARGDVLDFLQQVESLDKGQAIDRLRELAGGAAADPATIAAQAARRATAAPRRPRRPPGAPPRPGGSGAKPSL